MTKQTGGGGVLELRRILLTRLGACDHFSLPSIICRRLSQIVTRVRRAIEGISYSLDRKSCIMKLARRGAGVCQPLFDRRNFCPGYFFSIFF